ncbi:IPT/TIG domain-containing protein [Actinoplanes sp. HUAS TT8]|uniref:IPT/TIG domain-containing protein n=1 Tax=Actinoplanes sp. HUAS TT8 TaxID=3447453 RepID=UPI003F524734
MSRNQRKRRAVLTMSAVGAAVLIAPAPAFAATTVGPIVVPPGASATIMDPQIAFATSPTVQFSTTACPAKLATTTTTAAGPWNAGSATRTNPNAVTFTVPGSGGPTGGPNGAIRPFFACAYDGNSAGVSNLQAGAPIWVGSAAQAGPSSGVSGGGNQVSVAASTPVLTGITAPAAVFTTGTCNATLGVNNPQNLVATAITKQTAAGFTLTVPSGVTTTGPGATQYSICLYDGSSANGSLLSIAPYTVTLLSVTPSSGSYLSSNGVTVTSGNAFLSGVTAPSVLLVGNAGCPATWSTAPINGTAPVAIIGNGVRRLSNTRAAVTLPPLPLIGSQPTGYQVCVYGNNNLLGSGTYTAGIVAMPTAVFPAAGPAAGGNTITVVGTDFPADPGRITATLGGVPLTNIQSLSDKAFTAQAPAHSAEANVALVVSTSAGTKALPGAYSYLNPIKVGPNTAPNNAASIDVSVQGTGFLGISFGNGGNTGRVFLVDGVYNGADAGAGARANGPVAECVNVLPLSDEELVCTLQLNRRLNAQGADFFNPMTYTNTLTTDVSAVAGSRVVVSAGGRFNANDVGQPILQSGNGNIPAGSIVTSVLSPAKAVISAPAVATSGSAFTATIGNSTPVRALTGTLTTATGSSTVGLTSGAFTRADVGRQFFGTTGIPNGTTITSVTPGGASATLSAPATAGTAGTIANVSISEGQTSISGTALAATDSGAVVLPNAVGVPAGATLGAITPGTSATLSVAATATAAGVTVPVQRPVTGSLYAAAPVAEGAYNLVVVSNGAPDAANNDPDYFQTDVTSSSTFTVAAF